MLGAGGNSGRGRLVPGFHRPGHRVMRRSPAPATSCTPGAGDTGGQPKSPNLRSAHPLDPTHRRGGWDGHPRGRDHAQRRRRVRTRQTPLPRPLLTRRPGGPGIGSGHASSSEQLLIRTRWAGWCGAGAGRPGGCCSKQISAYSALRAHSRPQVLLIPRTRFV